MWVLVQNEAVAALSRSWPYSQDAPQARAVGLLRGIALTVAFSYSEVARGSDSLS
jgi:hypothetical protein